MTTGRTLSFTILAAAALVTAGCGSHGYDDGYKTYVNTLDSIQANDCIIDSAPFGQLLKADEAPKPPQIVPCSDTSSVKVFAVADLAGPYEQAKDQADSACKAAVGQVPDSEAQQYMLPGATDLNYKIIYPSLQEDWDHGFHKAICYLSMI
ncbi:hypothetical protein ABH926_010168 [Catenulispora sp. GP43]|uniref:hypothetical protein n=1 Tax=Catenulispora sp. GP43 TaxID=3156263 RepID=UPI0035136C7E